MSDVADKARDAAAEIRESVWPDRVARAGLCARAAIYAAVAAIALRVAFKDSDQSVDKDGALEGIAASGFGRVLLVVLAIGFTCHIAWRLMKAIVGAGEGSGRRRGATGGIKRLLDVGRAGVYVALFVNTIDVLRDGDASGASTDARAQNGSAQLMANPAGRWLVIAAGAGLIIVGVVLVARALAQKFEEHLERKEMRPWERTWLPRLGLFGYASRGVVAALVGVFVVHAGATFDPSDAVGLDGAARRLAQTRFGAAAVAVMALGLLSFAVYTLVEARYRKVLDD